MICLTISILQLFSFIFLVELVEVLQMLLFYFPSIQSRFQADSESYMARNLDAKCSYSTLYFYCHHVYSLY